MAAGDEVRKSFASDAATYNVGIIARDAGGANEALMSALTNKKAATPAAHRSTVSSADSADISSATGALDVGNSMHVALFADFSAASITATVFLALFDAAGNLIGVTEKKLLTADALYTDGAGGRFVSPALIFDVGPASQVLAKVAGISSGNVTFYLMAL
jgi:hypothetical protein